GRLPSRNDVLAVPRRVHVKVHVRHDAAAWPVRPSVEDSIGLGGPERTGFKLLHIDCNAKLTPRVCNCERQPPGLDFKVGWRIDRHFKWAAVGILPLAGGILFV